MKRKGMGAGKGKGYKNIIKGYDKKVHTDSGKGIKQPQRMPHIPQSRQKSFYLEDEYILDIWTDDTPENVISYFTYIINKIPKNINVVELNNVFVGNENNPHGNEYELNDELIKPINNINLGNESKHITATYSVSGKSRNEKEFINLLKKAEKIFHKSNISTGDIEDIEINQEN